MRLFRKRDRTIYSCGNCREQFKNESALRAHHVCPLVLIQRDLAQHNVSTRREALKQG